MSMNDPIADLLTRIRNANLNGSDEVNIPSSVMKVGIVDVMKREGYIKEYKEIQDGVKKTLRVYLKYGPMRKRVINKITRESKCGKRVYNGVDEIGAVLGGLGIAILSTSNGILSNRECWKAHVGGELLCTMW